MTEQTAKQYCGSAAVKSLFLYWLLCTKELDGDAQSMLGNLARGMLKEKKVGQILLNVNTYTQ